MSRKCFFAVIIITLFLCLPSIASTLTWTQSTSTEFRAGTLTNATTEVALGSVILKANYRMLTPESATATSIYGGQVPSLAIDSNVNTDWYGSANSNGQWISFILKNDTFVTPDASADDSTASSIYSGQAPNLAIDKNINTEWYGQNSDGQWIRFVLSRDTYSRTGVSATASNIYSGQNPSFALDDDTSTSWYGQGADGNWIKFDLGSIVSIDGIRIWCPQSQMINVSYSTNEAAYTSPDNGNIYAGIGWTFIAWPSDSMRYIRVTVVDRLGATYPRVAEFGYRTANSGTKPIKAVRIYSSQSQLADIMYSLNDDTNYIPAKTGVFLAQGWNNFSWDPIQMKLLKIIITERLGSTYPKIGEFAYCLNAASVGQTTGASIEVPAAVSVEVAISAVDDSGYSEYYRGPEGSSASSIFSGQNPGFAIDTLSDTAWYGATSDNEWIRFTIKGDAYRDAQEVSASSIFSGQNPGFAIDTLNDTAWYGATSDNEWIRFAIKGNVYSLSGVTATASTVFSGQNASFALDNSTDTEWYGSTSNNEWIKFDLGAIKDVSGVRLYSSQYQIVSIETSSNDSAYAGKKTSVYLAIGWNYFNWTPDNARYIRVKVTDRLGNTYPKISEFGFCSQDTGAMAVNGIRLYSPQEQQITVSVSATDDASANYSTVKSGVMLGIGWNYLSWSPAQAKYVKVAVTNRNGNTYPKINEFGYRTAVPETVLTDGVRIFAPSAQSVDIQTSSDDDAIYTSKATGTLIANNWKTFSWGSTPTKYIKVIVTNRNGSTYPRINEFGYHKTGTSGSAISTQLATGWNTLLWTPQLTKLAKLTITDLKGQTYPRVGEFKFLAGQYLVSGTLESSTFDTGIVASYETISWNPTTQASQCGTSPLKFRIATSSEASPAVWSFKGPGGSSSAYYTQPTGEVVWSGHKGDRYIKYRAYFTTADNLVSPKLDDISIGYDDVGVPPVVTLEAPNAAGIYLTAGNTYVISWEATDNVSLPVSDCISLFFTRNNGVNWTLITSQEENDPGSNVGTYEWTVPNVGSNNLLVSVEVRDASGLKAFDVSDNKFTIRLPLVYVSDLSGSDLTGTGSKEQPFNTVQTGLNFVEQGGIVSLEAGLYDGTGNYAVKWPARNNITLKGALMQNTTLDAQSQSRLITLEAAVNLTIEAVTLNNGYVTSDVEGLYTAGGGIYLMDGSTLWLNKVKMNNCRVDAGYGKGGAVYSSNSNVHALNCIFSNNGYRYPTKKTPYGGVAYQGTWDAVDCIFYGNYAHEGGVAWGGAWNAQNCLFYKNNVHNVGGVAYNSQWIAANCTFGYNSAYLPATGNGGVAVGGVWDLKNCILWGNTAEVGGQAFDSMSSVSAQYSDIQKNGWIPGTGNISVEPFFIATSEPVNFHLLATSECIDAGTYVGAPAYDLEGIKRPQPAGDDTINFDMGCYEQAGAGIPIIKVVQPNGGEVLYRSSIYDVKWQISGAVSGNVTIRFSSNEGHNWNVISTDQTAYIGTSSWSWNVPNIVTNECLISIEAAGFGGANHDVSDGYFEISNAHAPPSIEAVYINGNRFLTEDIISPKVKMDIHIFDLDGINSVELIIDGYINVIFTPRTVATPEEIWGAVFTMPLGIANDNRHSFTFNVRNNFGVLNNPLVMYAHIMRGKVEVVEGPLNYPNPFKPLSGQTTNIQYTLSSDAKITILVYDISGHEIKRYNFSSGINGGRAGVNSVNWNGRSLFNEISGNGMYIYKIISDGKVLATGKLIIFD